MAVISVRSTKGGVGKTTLVICLADAIARRGLGVVVVDAGVAARAQGCAEVEPGHAEISEGMGAPAGAAW